MSVPEKNNQLSKWISKKGLRQGFKNIQWRMMYDKVKQPDSRRLMEHRKNSDEVNNIILSSANVKR